MRRYTGQHRFYAGIDLHARSMFTHILDHQGQTVFEKDLPAEPEFFLDVVNPFRDGLVAGAECPGAPGPRRQGQDRPHRPRQAGEHAPRVDSSRSSRFHRDLAESQAADPRPVAKMLLLRAAASPAHHPHREHQHPVLRDTIPAPVLGSRASTISEVNPARYRVCGDQWLGESDRSIAIHDRLRCIRFGSNRNLEAICRGGLPLTVIYTGGRRQSPYIRFWTCPRSATLSG